jgi:hypothetical protein
MQDLEAIQTCIWRETVGAALVLQARLSVTIINSKNLFREVESNLLSVVIFWNVTSR